MRGNTSVSEIIEMGTQMLLLSGAIPPLRVLLSGHHLEQKAGSSLAPSYAEPSLSSLRFWIGFYLKIIVFYLLVVKPSCFVFFSHLHFSISDDLVFLVVPLLPARG